MSLFTCLTVCMCAIVEKPLLMLKAIKGGYALKTNDPRFHVCLVKFLTYGEMLAYICTVSWLRIDVWLPDLARPVDNCCAFYSCSAVVHKMHLEHLCRVEVKCCLVAATMSDAAQEVTQIHELCLIYNWADVSLQ